MRIPATEIDTDNLTAHCYLGIYDKRLNDEQRQQILDMLEAGHPQIEIGRIMGLPTYRIRALVYQQRQQRKMEMSEGYKPDDKFLLAVEMWNQGLPVSEIAKAYNYNTRRMNGVIERYRKAFGWFPKRRN
jgi:hypothetical protein